MKKTAVILAAVCLLAYMLTGCSSNVGLLAPLSASEEKAAAVTFEEAGLRVSPAGAAEVAEFSYKWQEPVKDIQLRADLYRDGQYTSEPVTLTVPNVEATEGTIALFTEELDGQEQEFSLFLSSGSGSNAKVYVQTGSVGLGEAMSPASTVQLEETQITELGEENVLLVMHDGPALDTAMENSLNETAQLIENSTYTLVLTVVFS